MKQQHQYDYDYLVIGGGSGGVASARRAAELGAKVAIAERAEWGGTCVNRGCIPKKLLRYAAEFSSHLEDAQDYGWRLKKEDFSWEDWLAKKEAEIDRLSQIYDRLLDGSSVDKLVGSAKIIAPHEVEVESKRYTAKHILIAVGGEPFIPSWPGHHLLGSSRDAFSMSTLPQRLLVIGSGYIGVELASLFHHLGVDTTLTFRSSRILPEFDASSAQFCQKQMEEEGLNVLACHLIESFTETEDKKVEVLFSDGTKEIYDRVIAATGRRPVTKELWDTKLAIECGPKGKVVVDSDFQTTLPYHYAVGDCIEGPELTPVAIAQGRYLAHRLFDTKEPTLRQIEWTPTAIFGIPEMASVGLAEQDLEKFYQGQKVEIYQTDFRPMKYTLTRRSPRVFLKMIVLKKSRQVLSVHMVGEGVSEIAQILAVALSQGIDKEGFDNTVALHPTLSEELVLLRHPHKTIEVGREE